ncbi:hypothetical protein FHX52_0624 [Humibacillus xanthopallidus]|uniref:DUF5302 domain-containing protein n=1 Tax=Humibacillus xanthopallidus TaxID=412689 RepID=A0A543PTW2_9MICO|nr:DUF5302 domain-containing protein [Humibacillus xanthopallidus]TQN47522.1 hypothetical protein FHX52_0624 [Humibacillus xanthopallidus]HET7801022.1 DUF5302 domain-containing protein [Humibacillus xanthopallidus]
MSTKDGDTSAQEKGSSEGGKSGPSEDMKAKFRAALDKKHAHGGKDVSDDGDRSKVHGAHGPAKSQQMFRRKSGG